MMNAAQRDQRPTSSSKLPTSSIAPARPSSDNMLKFAGGLAGYPKYFERPYCRNSNAATMRRELRLCGGQAAPADSPFSTARFGLFDRAVTSRRKLPTATFRRPPRLHEPEGVSSAVPMAATSTSGFFFLRLERVLVRF